MSDERPFRILGVQQVAIGAPDRSQLRRLWVELLGGVSKKTFQSRAENVDEEVLVLGEGALQFELDLMQPLDLKSKPRVDVPALNHVGLWVDDLQAAYDWLQAKGVRFAPGGIRKGAAGHDICFIHPRATDDQPVSGHGVLLELVQAPEQLLEQLQDAAEQI